jgi:hypothetical protein
MHLQIQHHFSLEDFSMSWLPTITNDYEIAKSKVNFVPRLRTYFISHIQFKVKGKSHCSLNIAV